MHRSPTMTTVTALGAAALLSGVLGQNAASAKGSATHAKSTTTTQYPADHECPGREQEADSQEAADADRGALSGRVDRGR